MARPSGEATDNESGGASSFTPQHHQLLIAHYERVAPLLVASFGGTPLIAGFVHDWATKTMTFEGPLAHLPASIAGIDVPLRAGTARYAALAANAVLWQAHRGALAFLSWSPSRTDPARVGYGRILVRPCGLATHAMVVDAAHLLRDRLLGTKLRSIPLLSGDGGISLWIPFSNAPSFDDVRASLDELCAAAATDDPASITVARSVAERGDRVHLAAGSNAVGRFSALPYSLETFDTLPVQIPIAWDEIATLAPGSITAANFAERLATHGDVFARESAAIGVQRFEANATRTAISYEAGRFTLAADPRGRIIRSAIAILDDGKPRDADELCAEMIARDLVPKSTTRKDVYTELIEYISRAKGHDRTPQIVQDPDRRFRRNLPADDWPAPLAPLPSRAPVPNAVALIARLRESATGDDAEAYELAVCDAFAALGFVATHVGGAAAPDGYIDAPLGTAGYRVMLECKRGRTIVMQPDAAEAAKYVAAYHAQFATLIGPAFGNDIELAGELLTHGVTAITNDDLSTLLSAAATPAELRAIFQPGFAAERIELFLWERDHGLRKRIAVICDVLRAAGSREQIAAAKTGDPADAPRLDPDAAMMLVDDELLGREGSQRPAARGEVIQAFAHLSDPLVACAEWLDDAKSAIVITNPIPLRDATETK